MLKKSLNYLCIRCKGYNRLCNLPSCPILKRISIHFKLFSIVKDKSVYGATPPSVIVGEKGYPKVSVLYNIPPKAFGYEAKLFDEPNKWWGTLSLEEIAKLRSSLVSSIIKAKVGDPWTLYEKEVSIAAVSSKPVPSEAFLSRRIKPRLSFDGILAPIGPSAPAEKIIVSENPSIPKLIEKFIWDDFKASDAIWELYRGKLEFYDIVRALSLGLLGLKRGRKLVPTRWAITAVDSTTSNKLLSKVRFYEQVDKYMVYFSQYLGNKFTIILSPGTHCVEWIEAWHASSIWGGRGGVGYASLLERPDGTVEYMDGGYFAARLPLLEHLDRIQRKASVVIIREIGPEYYLPLGNWHIRLTVRNALSKEPLMVTDNPREVLDLIKGLHPKLNLVRNSRLIRKLISEENLLKYV